MELVHGRDRHLRLHRLLLELLTRSGCLGIIVLSNLPQRSELAVVGLDEAVNFVETYNSELAALAENDDPEARQELQEKVVKAQVASELRQDLQQHLMTNLGHHGLEGVWVSLVTENENLLSMLALALRRTRYLHAACKT